MKEREPEERNTVEEKETKLRKDTNSKDIRLHGPFRQWPSVDKQTGLSHDMSGGHAYGRATPACQCSPYCAPRRHFLSQSGSTAAGPAQQLPSHRHEGDRKRMEKRA